MVAPGSSHPQRTHTRQPQLAACGPSSRICGLYSHRLCLGQHLYPLFSAAGQLGAEGQPGSPTATPVRPVGRRDQTEWTWQGVHKQVKVATLLVGSRKRRPEYPDVAGTMRCHHTANGSPLESECVRRFHRHPLGRDTSSPTHSFKPAADYPARRCWAASASVLGGQRCHQIPCAVRGAMSARGHARGVTRAWGHKRLGLGLSFFLHPIQQWARHSFRPLTTEQLKIGHRVVFTTSRPQRATNRLQERWPGATLHRHWLTGPPSRRGVCHRAGLNVSLQGL